MTGIPVRVPLDKLSVYALVDYVTRLETVQLETFTAHQDRAELREFAGGPLVVALLAEIEAWK